MLSSMITAQPAYRTASPMLRSCSILKERHFWTGTRRPIFRNIESSEWLAPACSDLCGFPIFRPETIRSYFLEPAQGGRSKHWVKVIGLCHRHVFVFEHLCLLHERVVRRNSHLRRLLIVENLLAQLDNLRVNVCRQLGNLDCGIRGQGGLLDFFRFVAEDIGPSSFHNPHRPFGTANRFRHQRSYNARRTLDLELICPHWHRHSCRT
jgi:hypothetical protein